MKANEPVKVGCWEAYETVGDTIIIRFETESGLVNVSYLPKELILKIAEKLRIEKKLKPQDLEVGRSYNDYDSGLLNDFGGGNVNWWQNYIRAEIDRCNDYWREQLGIAVAQPQLPVD